MKLNFLCIHHRHWLTSNPHAAIAACLDACDRAADLAEAGDFLASSRHAGCALEAAQILVDTGGAPSKTLRAYYCDAAAHLIGALQRLDESAAARHVERGVLATLARIDASAPAANLADGAVASVLPGYEPEFASAGRVQTLH